MVNIDTCLIIVHTVNAQKHTGRGGGSSKTPGKEYLYIPEQGQQAGTSM